MRLLVGALVLSLVVATTAAVFAIWPVVADAPWEDDSDSRPRHTAPEILEAARAQEGTLAGCDRPERLFFIVPPTWNDMRQTWVLACVYGDLAPAASVLCYEVDDESLEVSRGATGVPPEAPFVHDLGDCDPALR